MDLSYEFAFAVAAIAVLIVFVALRYQRRVLEREWRTTRHVERISDSIPIGLFRAARDGRCLAVNKRCLEITGLSREETMKRGWWSAVHPEDVGRVNEEWSKASEAGAAFLSEYRVVLANGGVRRVLSEASPIWDEKGTLLEYQGSARDVSELRSAEAMEATLGRILDESLNEILIYDLEAEAFVYANMTALTNLGYTLDELRELGAVDLSPELSLDRFEALLRELATGERKHGELHTMHRRKDGTSYPTEVYLHFTKYRQRPVLVGTGLDITKRVETEQELRTLESQLRQRDRLESLGTMASGIAHEINNPIQGAMCYAELLYGDLEKGSAQRQHAEEIMHEVERVAEIVRKLLRFARQEAEPKQLNSISDIVEESASLIRSLLRRDAISLEFDLPDDLSPVYCHGQQLQQVLMTLFTNARDALNMRYPEPHPNKLIRIEARVEARGEQGSWVRITVEDFGTGIPPGIKDQVFDPFFTTKGRSANAAISGAGLGLSVGHGIIAEHGGHLTVESELGAYTRFHIELPAGPAGLIPDLDMI